MRIYEQMDSYISESSYPNHVYKRFFRGGMNGSPQSLWANHRDDIEAMLSDGSIELLGMTIHENTGVQDFTNWIDLALSYNADTSFFIGVPWSARGPLKTTSVYNNEISQGKATYQAMVDELRTMYPNNAIYYYNYGFVASRMRELFDNNELEDVQSLCCDNSV